MALLLMAGYGLVWLLTLGLALTRVDLEPVTRLMWVIVVIFVPVAGVFLYAVLAPPRRREWDGRRHHLIAPTAGTPWEDDPGHTGRKGT